MIIKELSTTNYKHAVVELSYDEIRCLSNSLYQICKAEDIDADFVKRAKKGDIILVAGKGHENYQEIKGVRHHFDDVEELTKALNEK